MGLPIGEVCFLFSDIEGSTRLARALGADRWASFLQAHDRLIDDAVEREGGQVVKHEGDGTFAVFGGPTAVHGAALTAVAIARGMTTMGDGEPARVRIGLHLGDGRLTGGGSDYVGLDVHYAARIGAAGNGGQIVLSAAAADRLRGSLPPGTELADEGHRRLKDFDEPRPVFRLVVPECADDTRPLRTLDLPTNLPDTISSFVGRAADVRQAADLLATTRLLTLTGTGGTGKTRLALGVAAAVRDRYPDGTWLVDLAPIRDAALVASAIGAVLGVHETPETPILGRLQDRLRERTLLLVLDNVEQLLPVAADVVAALLASSRGLEILATSREALHLRDEQEFPVAPLDTADAVELFVDRARLVRPDYEPGPSLATIAAIVERVSGLPLAVELAAARVRLLSPEAILERLSRSLDLLESRARDLPERQRTLRAAIGWSVDLLAEPERRLFRRMSVFPESWSLESATAVADPDGDLGVDPIDGLAALADRSLVQIDPAQSGEPRFAWLGLVREYALEELTASGERPAVERRHAHTFLEAAERAEPRLLGEEGEVWLDAVDRDRHDLRAAMRWSLTVGEPALGLRITYAIWRYWQGRSELREGRAWTRELLAHPAAAGDSPERVLGLAAAGGLAYWSQDAAAARAAYEERLAIAERLGDPALLAEAHYDLGFSYMIDEDAEGVRRHEAEALRLYELLGDQNGAIRARQGVVLVSMLTGDLIMARDLERENLVAFRASREPYRTSDSVTLLASLELKTGELEEARSHALEGLEIAGTGRLAGTTVGALGVLSLVALQGGDLELGATLAGAAAGSPNARRSRTRWSWCSTCVTPPWSRRSCSVTMSPVRCSLPVRR